MLILIPNLILFLITIIFVIALAYGLINKFYNFAPFVPSSQDDISKMLELANLCGKEKVADLGSGNGKLVIAFSKKAGHVDGFEINPVLYICSYLRIKLLGIGDRASIKYKNFMSVDLSSYDVIVIYGISSLMPILEKKLTKEIKKKKVKIISNIFPFPDKKPVKSIDKVFLYVFSPSDL